MKSTGVVRKIDTLGRIVLPIELRRVLGIDAESKDPIEVFVDGESIILKKYKPGCVLCGSVDERHIVKSGKRICVGCVVDIQQHING